jgi:hypothetical protein
MVRVFSGLNLNKKLNISIAYNKLLLATWLVVDCLLLLRDFKHTETFMKMCFL